VSEPSRARLFEQIALPHLDAAYRLARWLTRSDTDAEDVVQEAYLRAFKYFAGQRGDNPRAWLLSIVRHAAYDWLQRNRSAEIIAFDEAVEAAQAVQSAATWDGSAEDPLAHLLRAADRRLVNEAIAELPVPFREALVLREFEELSYRQIAEIAGVPIGTVMSRLARARHLIGRALHRRAKREAAHGM
jgi:RNA polymerase sigma-70 factor (ECF subfamily)